MDELNTETGLKTGDNRLMRLIYYLFPFVIILAVMLTFLWMFKVGKIGYILRGLFTAVPAILSCLFILIIYRKNLNLHNINVLPSLNNKSLIYLYWIFYTGSLVSLLLSHGDRPWYYFIFILMLYLSVFLQIFSESINPSLILLEIFLIMINLIYSVTLNFDFYFGTTDILPHIFISELTAISGQIIPASLSDYAYFPLYHIFLAEASELLNMGAKTSLFVITAPIYAVTVVFLYYLFNYITNNRQISLLSCLIFSVSSDVIYYGANVITRTMAFIAFVILLYLIYAVNFKKEKISLKTLSVIVAIFLTLVHNVSLPQIVLLLIILFFSEYLIRSRSYISKPFFLFLNVTFVGYWFFVAYLFVQQELSPRLQSHLWDSVILTAGGAEAVQESFISLIGLLDSSIFLFFALIGISFLLKNYKRNYASVFGLFAFLTLVFYIPNPLSTIWQLKVLFRFDRFVLLVSPFMAFVMGYGIYIFWNYISKDSPKKLTSVFLIALLFSGFVLVSSLYSIGDSDLLGQDAKHQYFTSEEMSSFKHVLNYSSANSAIYTDYYTSRFFYIPLIPQTITESSLSPYQIYRIGYVNNIPKYKGYTVLRTREFLRSGLYFGIDESTRRETPNYFYQGTPENKLNLDSNLDNLSKIYSNSATDVFIPHSGLNSYRA